MMHQIVDVDDYFPDEIGTNSQAFMESLYSLSFMGCADRRADEVSERSNSHDGTDC